jgi:adenosylcobinamide-phosphate synthase
MIFATGEMFTDRVALLIAALLLNGLFAGPRVLYRALRLNKPGQWSMQLLRTLERKLNREKRTPEARRKRGTILVVAWLLAATVTSFALLAVLKLDYYGSLVELLIVAMLLGTRQSADIAHTVATQVQDGKFDEARAELSGTAWRNSPLLDAHGLCRAGIETVAVQFADRVVAPIFWYVLLGLPGLLVCRSITLMADATAHVRDTFGWAAERMSAAAYCVPSVISSFLIALASVCIPTSNIESTFRSFGLHIVDPFYRRRQLAVMGAALDVSLGGTLSVYAQGPWVGGDNAKALPTHVRRAVLILWTSSFMLLLVLLLALA